jgi:peptidoglycan-N-acetylglucosamine deacetylase
MFSRRSLLVLLIATAPSVPGLAAEAPQALTQPGILLTFDDTHVAEWVAAIPMLEKYNARATFFVTRFDRMTRSQLDGLKQLEAAGHTIGCHGLRHIKAVEHTTAHGVESYLEKEITPALAHMEKAGFAPTSFAYPMSNNNAATDKALLTRFRHVRTGTGVKAGQRYVEVDALFTPTAQQANRGCLIGKGIDRIGEPGKEDQLTQLFEAMERAASKGEILTLYAHGIAASGKHHHLMPDTLEKILAHGQHLGLRFYGFDELP